MKTVSQGSVLLTMFLILSVLSILCGVVWRTAVLTFDIALKKQEGEEYYQRTAALLNYGSTLCKENFSEIQSYIKNNRDLAVEVFFNDVQAKKYRCMLTMTLHKDNAIALSARLMHNDQQKYVLSCLVVRSMIKQENQDEMIEYFVVNAWKRSGFA